MESCTVDPRQLARPRALSVRRATARTLAVAISAICIGAASYQERDPNQEPERLGNRTEVLAAKPTAQDIDIWKLPIKDYPLLAKFSGLKRIRLYSREGMFVTDEHLNVLASLNFTNLQYINLNNCRLITDEGIGGLVKIKSLKHLQLEGTAISDAACAIMATRMAITDVNVANCTGVTKTGVQAFAKSEFLETIRFSADMMTPDEVLTLLKSFKRLGLCEIVDPKGQLDANFLKREGAERKIRVTVRRTGALQDKGLRR